MDVVAVAVEKCVGEREVVGGDEVGASVDRKIVDDLFGGLLAWE